MNDWFKPEKAQAALEELGVTRFDLLEKEIQENAELLFQPSTICFLHMRMVGHGVEIEQALVAIDAIYSLVFKALQK